MTAPLFKKMTLVGIGLIGSSLALAARKHGLVGEISCTARSQETLDTALRLGLVDSAHKDLSEAVKGADLIMLCTPIGAFAKVAVDLGKHVEPGAIVSDVGSVKQAVIRDVSPELPEGVELVPGHPIAGTEYSGPESGFATLFEKRWTILTPPTGCSEAATARVKALWEGVGAMVEVMDAAHHDQVLAVTSHLPHIIAYTIVGTADDLEDHLKQEVIKYSASGFRDFTRIAASDPTMWRDIFLNNREAVLEVMQRFSEDLTYLQRAIRWGEGDKLHDLFTRTRAIRKSVVEAEQAD